MRALAYFKQKDLLDLEAAIFSDTQTVKYCLIQESQKYFYIGESVHITNVFPRIRTALMNVESDILAHNLQKTVRATNLADWVIAVFKNPDLPDHAIVSQLKGFTQLHKAKRYEIHAKENIKVFLLEHKRYGAQIYLSTAIDLSPGELNSRVKRALKKRSENFVNDTLTAKNRELYIKLANAALHSASGDWKVTEIAIKHNPYNDIPSLVRSMNENFLSLDFKV